MVSMTEAIARMHHLVVSPASSSLKDIDGFLYGFCQGLAEVFSVENCSILLFGDTGLVMRAHHGHFSDVALEQAEKTGEGIAGHVFLSGQSLLVNDIANSDYVTLSRRPTEPGKSFMVVPLKGPTTVLGVINLSSVSKPHQFDKQDLEMLEILGSITADRIQLNQLNSVLSSKFAMAALLKSQPSGLHDMVAHIHDPGKIARLLARSFYRELRRSGFGSAQIVHAASVIISELSHSIKEDGRDKSQSTKPA